METLVKPAKKRFTEIDCLRGIGILLVVIGHSFFDKTDLAPQSVIFNAIYNFHMPLFFVISGFCFLRYAGSGLFKCVKKKTLHILVPYLFLSFVALFSKLFLSDLAKNSYALENWWQILLGISPMWPMWYLWTLFVVMFIFSFVFFKKSLLNYLVLLPISFCIYCFYPAIGGALGGFLKVARYQFYFLFGLFLRENYDTIKRLADGIKNAYKILLALFAVAGIFLIAVFDPFKGINRAVTYILSTFLGVTGFYLLSCVIAESKLSKIFTELSAYSMDIYIISYFTTLALEVVYKNVDTTVTYIYWIMVIACVLIGVLFPYFISKYIVRKIPVVRTLLLGYVPVK